MKSVKFLRHSSPYNEGEVATFSDRIASRLIEYGFAEAYELPKKQSSQTSSESTRERATLAAAEDKQMTSSRKKRSYETKGT